MQQSRLMFFFPPWILHTLQCAACRAYQCCEIASSHCIDRQSYDVLLLSHAFFNHLEITSCHTLAKKIFPNSRPWVLISRCVVLALCPRKPIYLVRLASRVIATTTSSQAHIYILPPRWVVSSCYLYSVRLDCDAFPRH